MQEENSDQTVMTDDDTKFESQQNSDNSDGTYVNTSCISKESESITFVDSENEEKSEQELLEQSEKLLKDMAYGLPNKDTDVLSPPESAFIDNIATNEIEENSGSLSEDSEHELKTEPSNYDYICPIEEATDKSKYSTDNGLQTKCDYMNKDLDKLDFTNKLNQGLDKTNGNESLVLNEQLQAELESIFTTSLPEYVNVANYQIPPIPPRYKYKNVLL